ncbi:MAG: LLM class F420-dependent oxidoreductase [Gaiella sp.]
MRVTVHFTNFDWAGGNGQVAPTLAAAARAAESAGCDSVTLMDHYFQMDQYFAAEDPMLEGYTTLGFLAAHTQRVRVGLLVTGVTYRHPGLLAKIIATLDVLSGGRAELGIGAAWYEREHRGLGVPFPPIAERLERLEETLQICQQMWGPETGPYSGRHYQLAETLCVPAPLSQPRPRVLIGGSGERKTLRLVALYADACNLFSAGPIEVARKLDVLRAHCEREQRDYDRIERTLLYVGDRLSTGDLDGFLAEMAEYAAVGVEEVAVMPTGRDPVAWLERLASITRRLAELEPAGR